MTLMHEAAPQLPDEEKTHTISLTAQELVLRALASQPSELIPGIYQLLRAHDATQHQGHALPDTPETFEHLVGDYLNHPEHQDN